MLMLFWEAIQCNKRFRSFIIDTDRAHDFTILVLFYALDQKNDPTKQGLIRMCVFILQTMSVEANFGKSLNKRFEGQESLPLSIRIPNFHGTYADYLITVRRAVQSQEVTLTTRSVHLHTPHQWQGQAGSNLSRITRNHQQHRAIFGEHRPCYELKTIEPLRLHVSAVIFARQ
jgi:hypothetical protein